MTSRLSFVSTLALCLTGLAALPGCYTPSSCETYCGATAAGGCVPNCVALCEEDRRIARATDCDEPLAAAIDCAEENACTEVNATTCRPRPCRGYYAQFQECVERRCVAHPEGAECPPSCVTNPSAVNCSPREPRSCAATP